MDIPIKKLNNAGNNKGIVYEIVNSEFGNYGFIVIYRHKGPKSKLHFHTGNDKSNDPQKLILLKGKMVMTFIDRDGETQELTLKQGDYIKIPKMVKHAYECLEDCIFLEQREQEYDRESPDVQY